MIPRLLYKLRRVRQLRRVCALSGRAAATTHAELAPLFESLLVGECLELRTVNVEHLLHVDEIGDLVEGGVAKLNQLLGCLFGQEVLAEERRVNIFVEFLKHILLVDLVVDIGVEVLAHVQVGLEGCRGEEFMVVALGLDGLAHLEGADAHLLLEGV